MKWETDRNGWTASAREDFAGWKVDWVSEIEEQAEQVVLVEQALTTRAGKEMRLVYARTEHIPPPPDLEGEGFVFMQIGTMRLCQISESGSIWVLIWKNGHFHPAYKITLGEAYRLPRMLNKVMAESWLAKHRQWEADHAAP